VVTAPFNDRGRVIKCYSNGLTLGKSCSVNW
jgi:hypothetical protein